MDDPYAEWRALNRRRTTCLREGLCTCCAFIRRGGDPWPRPVRATWRWVTDVGSVELLCPECARCWQANAAEDPMLAPRSLVMLEAAYGE